MEKSTIVLFVVLAIIALAALGTLIYTLATSKSTFVSASGAGACIGSALKCAGGPQCSVYKTAFGPITTCAGKYPVGVGNLMNWPAADYEDCRRKLVQDQPDNELTYNIGKYEASTGYCYPGILDPGKPVVWKDDPMSFGFSIGG